MPHPSIVLPKPTKKYKRYQIYLEAQDYIDLRTVLMIRYKQSVSGWMRDMLKRYLKQQKEELLKEGIDLRTEKQKKEEKEAEEGEIDRFAETDDVFF